MFNKKVYIFLMVLLLIFFPVISFAEDNLSINRWIIQSELLQNGDLSVSEDITFDFNDKFNGVYRDIILTDTDGIKDLQIFEMDKAVEIPYKFADSAKKGESNVFTVKENKNTLELMIFSPSKNEEKTFRIKYTVKNLAVKHSDTGELYYKFIGKENKTPIDYLSAEIKLPDVHRQKTKIFAHGPLNGQIYFVEDDLIKLEVSNVPRETFIEGRILFPKEFIGDSTNTGSNNYDNIINEELELIEKAKEKAIRKEKNKKLFNNLSLILSVPAVLIGAFIFNKFRRDVGIYDSLKSPYPEDLTPGELRLFYYSVVDARSLMTIIFDLSRKGYIEIEEIESSKKKKNDFQFKRILKSEVGLLSHEIFTLDWLFNTIGDGNTTNTIEIENYRKKDSGDYTKTSYKLQKLIKEDLSLREYTDKKGKPFGTVALILSIFLFVIGLVSLIFEGFYGALLMVLSISLFIYSIALFTRKSDKGYIQYQLWKDFRNDIKRQEEIYNEYNISIPTDKILIYALALGLPMKSVDRFREAIPESRTSSHWAYWYFLTNRRGGSSFEDRFNSSFYGSSVSTTSSSIGGGGGFSGGGGGGAGGGGAGGF